MPVSNNQPTSTDEIVVLGQDTPALAGHHIYHLHALMAEIVAKYGSESSFLVELDNVGQVHFTPVKLTPAEKETTELQEENDPDLVTNETPVRIGKKA